MCAFPTSGCGLGLVLQHPDPYFQLHAVHRVLRSMMTLIALRRFSKAFSRLGRSIPSSFFDRTSSFMVGPRKLTFGKKTDLELLVKMMKLERHQKFRGVLPTSFCVELLANACESMDYKMVRSHQPFFLHYRVDLLLQRVRYMETQQLTPRQKQKEIERYPPVLMLSFAPEDYPVNYFRGLIHCGEDVDGKSKFVHLQYQCWPRLRSYAFRIEENLRTVCEGLGVTDHCALQMAINMPCFLLWNVAKSDEQFRLIHRDQGLPFGYSLDVHTAPIFPPMLNPSFKLDYRLLTNKPNKQLVDALELFTLPEVLDYEFSRQNGRGKPEDLSMFLIENSRSEGANENSDL